MLKCAECHHQWYIYPSQAEELTIDEKDNNKNSASKERLLPTTNPPGMLSPSLQKKIGKINNKPVAQKKSRLNKNIIFITILSVGCIIILFLCIFIYYKYSFTPVNNNHNPNTSVSNISSPNQHVRILYIHHDFQYHDGNPVMIVYGEIINDKNTPVNASVLINLRNAEGVSIHAWMLPVNNDSIPAMNKTIFSGKLDIPPEGIVSVDAELILKDHSLEIEIP